MNLVDYKLIDAPSMLTRVVKCQDQHNPRNWKIDKKWYNDIRSIYRSYFKFLNDNMLLERKVECRSIDDLVIMYSDLNEIGKRFIATGAPERWLESFDRPGSKKAFSDVGYLNRALRNMLGSMN